MRNTEGLQGIYPLSSSTTPRRCSLNSQHRHAQRNRRGHQLHAGDRAIPRHDPLLHPVPQLEPIRDVLYSTTQGDAASRPALVNLMKSQIQSARSNSLRARAGSATVEQLLSLKVGDFINWTCTRPSRPRSLRAVFDCHYAPPTANTHSRSTNLTNSHTVGWGSNGS